MRHDLPPVESSQITGVFLGDEAVRYDDVLPPIIIQI
ncbi:MAG: hypothetical protein ACI957_005862, partial [Verrucomicrobiales bacterium]